MKKPHFTGRHTEHGTLWSMWDGATRVSCYSILNFIWYARRYEP